MRISVLLVVLLYSIYPLTAAAEIYRWVDANGNVVYGDTPPKKSGAKTVELPMLTVADSFVPKAASKPAEPEQKPDDSAETYTRFKIGTPAADESILANDGNLSVALDMEPVLKPGDNLKLYLDSKQVADGVGPSFPLSNLERGNHTVFAVVNNAAGDIVQNTETVTFSIRHTSALTPARSAKATP